jgi:hypothetical protein
MSSAHRVPPNEEEIPLQFRKMTNKLQICNWLVNHPDILKLSNEMLVKSKSSSSDPISSIPSSISDNVIINI